MGMRLAELSVMWHVNGWSIRSSRVFLHGQRNTSHMHWKPHSQQRAPGKFIALCRAGHTYVFSKYIARLCSGSRYAIISCSKHRRGQHQRKKLASNHPCVYGLSGALVLGTSRVSMIGIYRHRTNCEPCCSLWRGPSSLCREPSSNLRLCGAGLRGIVWLAVSKASGPDSALSGYNIQH